MEKTHQERVAEAKTRIREVTADEVRALPPGATVVDVRDQADWAQGHLPGARHLPRAILEARAEQELPDKDAPLVLYCGGGGRSTLATDALQALGYTDVRSLAGGFRGWKAAGLPTETE